MRDFIVYAQIMTMVLLAGYFWHDDLKRLAAAQCCYAVATVFLFVGVSEVK